MMEVEGADGSKLALKSGSKTIFGRGLGFNTSDRIVSRRHILLELETPVDNKGETQKAPRVSFEVTGKNPIWVRSRTKGAIKVFKKSEKGELADGDWFCVSGRIPVWFVLKRSEENGKEEEETDLGSDNGAESVDIEDIDPVKEFGFLVMGHEFDQYPNQRIRNIKNWDWFLEEYEKGKDSEDGDDEAVEGRRRGSKGKKRRKGDNDDDWTGESEDEIKEVTTKGRNVRRSVYSTRSKDRGMLKKDGGKNRSYAQKKTICAGEEGGVDDDDETLGGFIVEDDDDDLELEDEYSELDEQEEEDFDDEDEDNEDDE
ncbi:HIV Tat-specific factor 1 homolog [Durio zibethinus]|uniref:HIV Tat-specific factor 1 homolog n=1 Tax=Durio zibethinus TaxID=66656 RepID=A0A6P5WGD1_DURZI|nr:HIV Tat-specific factor 1 homolog [Durio zibethinus]